jgi:hypothetical protein
MPPTFTFTAPQSPPLPPFSPLLPIYQTLPTSPILVLNPTAAFIIDHSNIRNKPLFLQTPKPLPTAPIRLQCRTSTAHPTVYIPNVLTHSQQRALRRYQQPDEHDDLGVTCIAQLFSPSSILPKKLQSLNLSNTNITLSSLEVVLKASPHLTELILDTGFDWFFDMGPAVPALIATSAPNLTKLDLSHCNLTNEGYSALAASTGLSNLRQLTLTFNKASPESIIALINSPVMANLTHLDLGETHVGPEVLIAIAQSSSMSNLQHLIFNNNWAFDQGLIALAQSTTLTNLTSLDLTWNELGPEGVTALCTSPVVSKLTRLNLRLNDQIGNSIAHVLAAPSSTLYNLLDLNLAHVGMGDEGILQLLVSSNLDQLNALDVSENSASDSTAQLYLARFDCGHG